MSVTSHKSVVMQRSLCDALTNRLTSLAVTPGFVDGFPVIRVGDGGIGDDGVFIRIKPVDTIQKDVLLLDQRVFTPHVVQVAAEEDINTVAELIPIFGECMALGARFEYWEEADGTAPSATTFNTPAKLKAAFESLRWPLLDSQ